MASSTSRTVDLPVIDVSQPSRQVAGDLLRAFSTSGFAYIKNSEEDISPSDISDIFALSAEFFKSPTSVKEECSIHSKKSGKNHGWLSVHTEKLDPKKHKIFVGDAKGVLRITAKRGDFKEAFNFGEFSNGEPQQPLPGPLASRAQEIGKFMEKCHSLCNKLLQLVAAALEIPPGEGGDSWFSSRHDRSKGPSGSVLRLLYYPAITASSGYDFGSDIRAGAHSDYGSITLLFQLPGQPGLEILTEDNVWIPVSTNPTRESTPPILVNIGDLLSYWTNNLLKSTVHRVVVPKPESGIAEDRYSIAYFCHPLDGAELVPVPSKSVKGYENQAPIGYGGGAESNDTNVITARDHLNRRLAATYGLKG